ncbi:hypothetical protein FZI95_23840 [Mycobacterium sp. CBMA247]|nr:hypothetical protein [Mycolicibacterium sp. CBMA 329]MUL91075.1 hypothetical protein [Mycolicibacterium sp. CBMA 331]MUL98254.1 hypothetical protein [Mycolicibacterium sp. CBMA 334]MUM26132.1 hypothetical protein [Mycolicibacterium sp. CBMA 295]MUM40834.1 hypothetical protein [Mycolicibacterium sp. CBMA 247]MUM47030.1 hypothetical protein [Mycolicibacterium sp. CBMA 294]
MPWWGAVLLAITATAIGFAFDAGSGSRELSSVFAVCYSLGCLLAVLAVQQAGLFTAVIQPPLILFVAVPGSYFLFHGGQLDGVKDLAINCGYPLIERFPLMLFLSSAVLLIGLGRWYFGLTTRRGADAAETSGTSKSAQTAQATPVAGIVSSVTAKLSGLVLRKPATASPRRARSAEQNPAAGPTDAPPRRRPSDRPPRRRPAGPETGAGAAAAAGAATGRPRGERRPTKRTAPPRPRPSRTADGDLGSELDGAMPERPRRPRPPRSAEPGAGEPRRRVRTQPREPRKQPPPERREATSFDTPRERPQRQRRRFDDFQPFEDSFDPPTGSGRTTHHPVSRVRYRGSEDEDHRVEHRTQPRSAARGRHSREYDN